MGSDQMDEGRRAEQDGQSAALSIFRGEGAANDFPVLKAFQEYIDAEQAKARKRMLSLSIFFVILLVVVVVTFSVIMASVINRDQQSISAIANRNQELSDKLLDIALRERTNAQPVVTVQQPVRETRDSADSAVLKTMQESIATLTAAIAAQRAQPVVQSAPPPAPAPAVQSAPAADSAETARMREELRRQREELKEAKEKLRQQEVERQRRRLYPEYYAREDAKAAAASMPPPVAAPAPKPAPAPMAVPASKPVPAPVAVPAPKPAPASVAAPAPKPAATTVIPQGPVDLKTAKPVSYFNNDEEDEDLKALVRSAKKPAAAAKPAEEKPATPSKPETGAKTETINVGGTDFLIELPKAK